MKKRTQNKRHLAYHEMRGELGLRGVGRGLPQQRQYIGNRVRNPSVRKGRAIECEVHEYLLLLR